MKLFKKSIILFCCASMCLACNEKKKTEAVETEQKEEWVQLFNGVNLDGWTPKITGYDYGDNIHNTFRVEDSVIKVGYEGYDGFNGTFGHLFYKNSFSHYRLKIEYRFTGTQIEGGPGWAKRNSGVMIHCEDPKGMAKDQKFPLCIEVQMLGGIEEGTARATGNLCTPGSNVVMDGEFATAHCFNSVSDTYYGDQWVNIEVEVRGDSIVKHMINDNLVLSYSKPQIGGGDIADYNEKYKDRIGEALTGGYISLQSESHPVEFRKVEILELK